jgi:hypothetical protein
LNIFIFGESAYLSIFYLPDKDEKIKAFLISKATIFINKANLMSNYQNGKFFIEDKDENILHK